MKTVRIRSYIQQHSKIDFHFCFIQQENMHIIILCIYFFKSSIFSPSEPHTLICSHVPFVSINLNFLFLKRTIYPLWKLICPPYFWSSHVKLRWNKMYREDRIYKGVEIMHVKSIDPLHELYIISSHYHPLSSCTTCIIP